MYTETGNELSLKRFKPIFYAAKICETLTKTWPSNIYYSNLKANNDKNNSA
jgi:hypothetical protein